MVGIGLEVLHGRLQRPEGTGEQAGEQPAGEQGRQKHHGGDEQGQVYHLADVAVDQLVHVADTHHPPIAALHTGEGIDDGVIGPSAVLHLRELGRVLGFQAGVEQLLLGVIDHVAVPVHQKAVAPLANAYIIHIAGDAGKAQIQGDPGGRAILGQAGGHGDHPGVVSLENTLHVGSGHVGALGGLGFLQIKGEVLEDVVLGFPVGGPALEQLAVVGIAGHRHHVGAELQKGGQQLIPALVGLRHGLLHQFHGLTHIGQVVGDGGGHLRHGLHTGGAGVLYHGLLVAV